MKKIFLLMLTFIMLGGTTGYAKAEFEKIKLKANGEEIEFEIEEQRYEGKTAYRADPEIIMRFPEDFDGEDEKLYFRVKWATATEEEIDYDEDYYIKPRIFSFTLPQATGTEQEISLKLKFDKREYKEDLTYSLWLVGGDKYDDNFPEGKKDVLLKDDMIVFDVSEAETTAEPELQKTTEVFLTIGKETFQYSGEKKQMKAPILFNNSGRLMVAAKDIPMVMDGVAATGLTWDKTTRTVTLQMGEKTLSATDGSSTWVYQGAEVPVDTVAEIRNGSLYIPLREAAKLFGFTELTWDGTTQTVCILRNAV
ncbi:MAG: copper amine oxidase N-terminal domain-containing protein [Anaerotignum sp.]|nr:copper amine oxidase N-terminal domain-containing protein [Anaerotignum sp.]